MLAAALVFSNILGFVLQFALPFYLPPEEYAVYSVVLATSQILLIFSFEWIRLPLLRFSNVDNLFVKQRRGALFFYLYFFVFFVLLVFGVGAFFLNLSFDLDFLYVASLALLIAAFQGVFEGGQSYFRANFLNKVFAVSWILRSLATLFLCLLMGFYYQSATPVLFGYAVSFFIVFCLVYFPRYGWVKWQGLGEIRHFSTYGVSLAMAAFLGGVLIPLFKNYFVYEVGVLFAGGVFWAFDLFLKVFAILGMVVNISLSQKIIKKVESGAESDAAAMSASQIAGVVAMVLPVYLTSILLKNFVIELFAPSEYSILVLEYYFFAVSAAAIIAIRMFAVDALFIVFSKSKAAFVSPVVTIVSWGALSFFLDKEAETILLVLCFSLLIGLVFSFCVIKNNIDYVRFFNVLKFVVVLNSVFFLAIYLVVCFAKSYYMIAFLVFVFFLVYFYIFFSRQRDVFHYVFCGVRHG